MTLPYAFQQNRCVDGESLRLLSGVEDERRRERSNSLRSELGLEGEILTLGHLVGEIGYADNEVRISRKSGSSHSDSYVCLTLDCHGTRGGIDVDHAELQSSAVEGEIDGRAVSVDVSSRRDLVGHTITEDWSSELGHAWCNEGVDQAQLAVVWNCIVYPQIGAFDIRYPEESGARLIVQ